MKIAVIQNYFRPYIIGGTEINVENLISNLGEEKIPTLLITMGKKLRWEVTSPHPYIKIYRFYPINLYYNFPINLQRNKPVKLLWWSLNLWNPFVFFTVRSILKKERPDLVNIHNFYGLSPSVFTAAKSLNLPVIYSVHDFFALCRKSSFLKKSSICRERCISCSLWANWNSLFMRKIHFHFLSHFSAQILQKRFSAESSFIIPNPVYLTEEEIRKNMHQKEKKYKHQGPLRFLYLGRLNYHKGILTLLRAFQRVQADDVELWICGDGELRSIVENSAQKDRRIKYQGFVLGTKKREILLCADVLILPSEWYEISPLSIQEAYGFGLPVIGTDLGSIPEHIDQRQTGWLFPFRDENALANLIEDIRNKKNEIRRRSTASFHKALSNTGKIYVEKMVKEFTNLVGSRDQKR